MKRSNSLLGSVKVITLIMGTVLSDLQETETVNPGELILRI